MLDIKKTYIDFGEQLQPPPGYVIEYGVATSYSLDLYALLSIPLAMYYNQALDIEITEDNFQILEAVQNLPKHFKLYCQKGKILLPKSTSVSLLSFIEKCVNEVMPEYEQQSFHPKVWVLRYKSLESKETIYRVIVMSRNLTFDKSYDIAYWMQGKVGRTVNDTNTDLVKLMQFLDKKSPFSHKTFINDLKKVAFHIVPNFNDVSFSFFPKRNAEQAIDSESTYNQRLVISPFLSSGMVKKLVEKSRKSLVLFTRKSELDKLPREFKNIEAYYFLQEIVDHHLYEKAEEGTRDEYFKDEWDNNLHAKIYLREQGNTTYWDLGSANCSDSAFKFNYEFLVHLTSNNTDVRIQKVKDALLTEHNGISIFKRYDWDEEKLTTEEEEDFRSLEYLFLSFLENKNEFDTWVEPDKQTKKFNLNLKLNIPKKLKDEHIEVFCRPFGFEKGFVSIEDQQVTTFSDISLTRLSCFLHWQLKIKGTGHVIDMVTKADVRNMPDYRLSNILKSLIDNPDKFFQLLRSLLTDEPVYGITEEKGAGANGSYSGNNGNKLIDIPILEELLINLSRSPERLERLSELIDRLNDLDENNLIPPDFAAIWSTIKNFLPHVT